jgi:L-rhamnose-H+ transport protein
MQPEQILGFALMLLGAVCGGSFGLPIKYAKRDTPWEVLWGPFFLMATILIPGVVAPLVVNDLAGIYSSVGMATIVAVLVCGFLWGLGSMTLGMSFAFIGLSLAYALNYGAQIVFGSMMPMCLFDAEQILTPHGSVILAGVAICLVGVTVSGRAGILKDRSLKLASPATADPPAETAIKRPKMVIGLVIGVVSGVLCACYALASAYAGPIGAEAVKSNAAWRAAWAVTAIILWGGAVSSCLYCIIQLTRNRTWGHLTQPGAVRVFLLAAVMAVLHDAAIFLFGLGWIHLGDLGVPVGYPVFMSFAIIVGNVHGFRTGEWKGASRQSVVWILAGIALLIVGVCLLAQGKAMMPS